MAFTGTQLVAGRIPGERIATSIATSNSPAIAGTETVTDTVVAPVVSGRIYKVTMEFGFDLSVGGDQFTVRIREDSVTGDAVVSRTLSSGQTGGNQQAYVSGEYTADVTEDKTFVLTLQQASGGGNIMRSANAGAPAYFFVDYNRG